MALIQGNPVFDTATAAESANYSNELTVSGNTGTLIYTVSNPSDALNVSPSGDITTTSSLQPNTYTVSGIVTDGFGNYGIWTFTLNVVGTPFPQTSVQPIQPTLPDVLEIKVPFQIDPATGGVAVLTDYVAILAQHIMTIVLTSPGERLMLPAYGAGLEEQVFASGQQMASGILAGDIQRQIEAWEPAVQVISVNIVPTPQQPNVVSVVVVFRVEPGTDINQVVVNAGGSIAQVSSAS